MNRTVAVVILSCFVPISAGAQSGTAKKPSTPTPAATTTSTSTPTLEPLPAAVDAAFKKSYPNATITKTKKKKKEREGKAVYTVTSKDAGRTREIVYLATGAVISVTEDVNASEVPPAVATALAAKFSKETVKKRERIVEGRTTEYRFEFSGSKTKPVLFTPEGKVVSGK